MKKILVLNTGSSSLKYQLFNVDGSQYDVVAKGNAERIGIDGGFVGIKYSDGTKKQIKMDLPTHQEAIQEVFTLLLDGALVSMDEISAVGHRVVHGGEIFDKSTVIDAKVLGQIEELSVLAPLHNPAAAIGIKAMQNLLPNAVQVATFDTAFHQSMSPDAFLYALPEEQYTKHKVRRYGMHGTSHAFVSDVAAELIGKKGKIITCHMGNGASISAIDNGKCVDTSMGFTPLAGLMMGTRCGDIDPYIPLYIMKTQNKTIEEVNTLLNKESGVLGLSGFADMRDVEDRFIAGEPKCVQAMNTYIHTVLRFIGSYVAVLGGVDAIVFTAGVGENSPIMRKIILDKLSYLGITVNEEANNRRGNVEEISTPDSIVKAFVIPTNEELVIAQDTVNLM